MFFSERHQQDKLVAACNDLFEVMKALEGPIKVNQGRVDPLLKAGIHTPKT